MEITYLWVDEIQHNGYVGFTTDIDKIFYNLDILGDIGRDIEQDINIKMLTVTENVEAIFALGRFLCVINLQKDEKACDLHLFDVSLYSDEKWSVISKECYGSKLTEKVNNAVKLARSYFGSALDSFELSLSQPF